MFDIITVVFSPELESLRLQARSIDIYCGRVDLGHIVVVINDDLAPEQIPKHWWGTRADHVRVVHRSHWPERYSADGWLSQQVLKLLATELCPSTWSMVLDAKTILVNDLDPDHLVDDQGRICSGLYPVQTVFEPSRRISNAFWHTQITQCIAPAGVPFFFHNATVRKIINEVPARTGQSLAQWFQQQGQVTEFIFYSSFVWWLYQGFDTLYNTERKHIQACNVCHSEVDQFDTKFAAMLARNFLTVSVHRHAWSRLSQQQQQQYTEYLRSRHIE